MSNTNTELLATLRQEALINTIGGALSLTISGFWLINDNHNKTHDMYNRFRLPVILGLIYGTVNVVNGTIGLLNYDKLIIEANLVQFNASFFLTIPSNNITGTINKSLTTLTTFDINNVIKAINDYFKTITGLKIVSLSIEDAQTGATTNDATSQISSNIKIDITFIITTNDTVDNIISSILKGNISVRDNSGFPQKLNISSKISSKLNYAAYN